MATASGPPRHDYLRRLPPETYVGRTLIHWTMTVADRRTGWLDARAHAGWREALLHTLACHRLAVPVYCLMPDHAHLIMAGLSDGSDQRAAVSFLRRYSADMFAPVDGRWQKQAYDHVLRQRERTGSAFMEVARYIVQNPVRAGLAEDAARWPYSGSLVAGWPKPDWRTEDFWERWWEIFAPAEP